MGTVYLAEQLQPRRKVAVKIVAPDDHIPRAILEALRQEGNISARFEHDNLAHVYECGIVDDHYYLAMQYLAGGDLTARQKNGLGLEEIRSIMRAMAAALSEIHAKGFVHRDIKPGNILFTENGKPVLADFGIAKAADSIGLFTRAGFSIGTPAYMSPEQIKEGALDGRSDLYSLGVVLYQCLAGELPFQSDSDYGLKLQHIQDPPPPLTGESVRFQPILDRLLAKNPEDRYADAGELIQALDSLGELSGAAKSDEMPSQPSPSQPDTPSSPVTAWVREMSSRRVFRVVALYIAIGWGLTEIVTGVVERVPGLPDWLATATTIAFVVGLPICVALAWIFDVGPGGLQRLPTRRKGLLVASIAVAAVISLTWLVFDVLVESPQMRAQSDRSTSGTQRSDVDPVLAVLPFELSGEDAELAALATGIADDLVQALAELPGLRVKARGAAATLAQEGLGPGEVARRLGATHLVTASLERDGDAVRIRAGLLDPDDNLLWGQRFSDDLSRVYPLLQEIALEIGGSLDLAGLNQVKRIDRTINPRAYTLLAEAKVASTMMNPEVGSARAVALTKEAVALAPDYAEAHAQLGWFYAGQVWTTMDRNHPSLPLAEAHLRLASTLDPELPETDVGWAQVHWMRGDWMDAHAAVSRYLSSGDTDFLSEAAIVVNVMGYHGQASDAVLRALAVDPLNPVNHMTNCLFSTNARRLDEALASCEFMESRGDVSDLIVHYLGFILLEQGESPDVVRDRLLKLAPQYARMIDAVVDPTTRPDYLAFREQSDILPMDLAYDYYAFGTPEQAEAMAWKRVRNNEFNPPIYFMEPAAHLRSRSAFLEIMDAAGLVDLWRQVGPPAFCKPQGESFVCD